MMIGLDRPLIRGDGLAYFMWSATLVEDGDMDLANQAAAFGELNQYQATWNPATGRFGNAFAWGQGIVLAPAFVAARFVDQFPFMRVEDDWFGQLQRYPYAYSLLAMLEVNALTMVSLALTYLLLTRLGVVPLIAALSALAAAVGTPLLYYASIQPIHSHATATFVHTLAIFLFYEAVTRRTPWWGWIGVGAVAGLAFLTRWQLLPTYVILLLSALCISKSVRPFISLLGFGMVAWLVPYYWWWMFGAPFSPPPQTGQGGLSLLVVPQNLAYVLGSDNAGLLVWSPIVLAGFVGLLVAVRKTPVWPMAAILICIFQIGIVAAAMDPTQGEGFGARRLTEIYPCVALGVGWLLQSLQAIRFRRFVAPITAGVVATAAYGFTLIFASFVFGYLCAAERHCSEPPQVTASGALRFLLVSPNIDKVWPVMEHHFGIWAWSKPGP